MSSDIQLNDDNVIVLGNLGVNTDTPASMVEFHGSEVHSSGNGAGYSFATRGDGPHTGHPPNGERWVLYASEGIARLWSGTDKLLIEPGGKVQVEGRLTVRGVDVVAEIEAHKTEIEALKTEVEALRAELDAIELQSLSEELTRQAEILEQLKGKVDLGMFSGQGNIRPRFPPA